MAPISGRRKVSVQYRKLADPVGAFASTTLQKALMGAMESFAGAAKIGENVLVRTLASDKTYGSLVLNNYQPDEKFFFGEIVRFEPGADLPLLQTKGHDQFYNLAQAKAPEGHEALRGVLYFMAIGNHVTLVESDFATGRAEGYLTWLLTECSSAVSMGAQIILEAELGAETSNSQLSQIDKVVIKPVPMMPQPTQLPELTENEVQSTSTRGVDEGRTFAVLRAAGLDETDLQKIVADQTSIEVTLQIKFKDRRRTKSLVMENAKRLLRNVPEDDMVLTGSGGRQKGGRIIKLSYPANVEVVGALLVSKDVARALYEGFSYFLANGHIEE